MKKNIQKFTRSLILLAVVGFCVCFAPVNEVIGQETAIPKVKLLGELGTFKSRIESREIERGIVDFNLTLTSARMDTLPAGLTLAFKFPIVDIQSNWHPSMLFTRHLRITWQEGFFSNVTHNAPLMIALNAEGKSRVAFACSDAETPITVRMGVDEETSSLECKAELFWLKTEPCSTYSVTLRVDTRILPYSQVLTDFSLWYSTMYKPLPTPDVGRQPMYSSWYSFHKALNEDTLLVQCKIAKSFGCDAVIIDDGWQTDDPKSIYEDCGDWEVNPKIFPNFKKTVDSIHTLGLKALLWYAVPFAGVRSKAAKTFKDKMLYTDWGLRTHVLDVRYPEVRNHIASRIEAGVRDFGLDGVKLDFIDMLRSPSATQNETMNGRDVISVEVATAKLMADIIARLKAINPEILIEFRQSYISPPMRQYGNLFRAGDCANDALENRLRTLDIRLLSGSTTVHSDMITWNTNEPVEIAAQQILAVLFSVPQLSNRFEKIPQNHLKMIQHWMTFWKENRALLLDGKLTPLHPELNYPVVSSEKGGEILTAVYAPLILKAPFEQKEIKRWKVINATHQTKLTVQCQKNCGNRSIEIRDCFGAVVAKRKINFKVGVHEIEIPRSGYVTFY
ncbi:MAG: glycoside hydrolase family 36 protein [Chloroherpetonaceae bacterium]|nr:glycoside hydrolase family 36 protein [Chloroherpetonaceae bacterium]